MSRRISPILAAAALALAAAAGAQAEEPYAIEWVRQFGTSAYDSGSGVAADLLGNVFISGSTGGSLHGPNAPRMDAFVSKYNSAGSLLWTRQLGTSASDYSYGVAADPVGNVFISGYTLGNLGGPNAGSEDAFLVKLTVPEPSLALLASLSLPWLLRRRRYRRGGPGGRGASAGRRAALALLGLGALGAVGRRRRRGLGWSTLARPEDPTEGEER